MLRMGSAGVWRSDRITGVCGPTPPDPPFARGRARDVTVGIRWCVADRSDHWRVRPPPPLTPPLQGGKARLTSRLGSAGVWRVNRIVRFWHIRPPPRFFLARPEAR